MKGRWVIAALVFVLGGCATSEPPPPEQARQSVPETPPAREPTPEPRPLHQETFVAGHSVEKRPIDVHVLGDGADRVMIIATIHGDEAAGTPLTHRLREHLVAHPELLDGRQVVLIPVASPDGMHHGRRTNVRGIDLNRNFPASNFRTTRRHGAKPLSEPEARVLHRLIERFRPARIVSIHQPVSCIDWDGPGEALARAMARTCDLKAKRIGSRPGSLGSWVGLELKKPIITLELPRSADRLTVDQSWRRYGRMLVQAVVFPEKAP